MARCSRCCRRAASWASTAIRIAGSLRYHLGLVTPNSEDCHIFVDGQPYHWRDGEAVMFDETFIHWAENKTDQPRVILFCDVERPLTSRVMTGFNKWYKNTFIRASQTENMAGDHIGWLNRIFSVVYYLRVPGKALKQLQPDALLRGEVAHPDRAGLPHILRLIAGIVRAPHAATTEGQRMGDWVDLTAADGFRLAGVSRRSGGHAARRAGRRAGDLRRQQPHPQRVRRLRRRRLCRHRAGALRPLRARRRYRLHAAGHRARPRIEGAGQQRRGAMLDIAAAAGVGRRCGQGRRDRLLLGRIPRMDGGGAPAGIRVRGFVLRRRHDRRHRGSSRNARSWRTSASATPAFPSTA